MNSNAENGILSWKWLLMHKVCIVWTKEIFENSLPLRWLAQALDMYKVCILRGRFWILWRLKLLRPPFELAGLWYAFKQKRVEIYEDLWHFMHVYAQKRKCHGLAIDLIVVTNFNEEQKSREKFGSSFEAEQGRQRRGKSQSMLDFSTCWSAKLYSA